MNLSKPLIWLETFRSDPAELFLLSKNSALSMREEGKLQKSAFTRTCTKALMRYS